MNDETDTPEEKPERIAKRIARAGLCSRREAERWIEGGRVTINGDVLKTPAHTVISTDAIFVDGKVLPQTTTQRLWRYHKRTGLVTSHNDEKGRRTVFDALPKDLGRVISVGRLDMNSEGLLLLTNDGDLARALELPNNGWARRYRVRVYGRIDDEKLASIANGSTINGIDYGPIEATLDSTKGENSWVTMTLNEGKNREIRKVMEHLGVVVNRLIRVSYGPFKLADLKAGAVVEVPGNLLRKALIGTGAAAVGDNKPTSQQKQKTGWAKSKKSAPRKRSR